MCIAPPPATPILYVCWVRGGYPHLGVPTLSPQFASNLAVARIRDSEVLGELSCIHMTFTRQMMWGASLPRPPVVFGLTLLLQCDTDNTLDVQQHHLPRQYHARHSPSSRQVRLLVGGKSSRWMQQAVPWG